jgi:steroid 5-alpha reductase family enzyme
MSDLKKYFFIYLLALVSSITIYQLTLQDNSNLLINHIIAPIIYVSVIFTFTYYYNFTNMIDLAWGSLGIFLFFINFNKEWMIILKRHKWDEMVVFITGFAILFTYCLRHVLGYVIRGIQAIKKENEDFRYRKFEEDLKNFPKFVYWLFNYISLHIIPQLVLSFCFLPIFAAINHILNENKVFNLRFCYIAFFCGYLALILETLADEQLHYFRNKKKQNKTEGKQVMNEGFWKTVRHPNYLGEILYFWSLFLVYFGATGKVGLMFIGPTLLTAIFVFFSVPAMDKYLRDKYREEFKDYENKSYKLIPYIY